MKSQIRPAISGETTCDRCEQVANILYDDGRNLCFTHGSLDRDTFIAMQELKRAGLIDG